MQWIKGPFNTTYASLAIGTVSIIRFQGDYISTLGDTEIGKFSSLKIAKCESTRWVRQWSSNFLMEEIGERLQCKRGTGRKLRGT